jgi:hypothetical protein
MCFFPSETKKSLSEFSKVQILQDQAQLALAHYVSQVHPHNPARFGKMLLTLPCLKNIPAKLVQDVFFKKTIGQATMEQIIHGIQ